MTRLDEVRKIIFKASPIALAATFPSMSIEQIIDILAKPENNVILRDILDWNKDKGIENPLGLKEERVIVLGAFETWPTMRGTARYISEELGYHVVTSKYFFPKGEGAGKKIPMVPSPQEYMNDFLFRLINQCKYAVVTYMGEEGGQLIETSWCWYHHKPTLGIVGIREIEETHFGCPYLRIAPENRYVICDGGKAVSKGEEYIGSWICTKNVCPFVKKDLTKMILDFYMSGVNMYLVGSPDEEYFHEPISSFLENQGKLPVEDITQLAPFKSRVIA